MSKPVQKRALATRAKMIEVAEEIIASNGFAAMRVEDVVQNAGVAKGTFFAHFRDKDALLELIIGARIDAHLDDIERHSSPKNLDDLINQLLPLLDFMASERYVFDLIIRYSGAFAREEIGPIAQTFIRQIEVFAGWFSDAPFRQDVSAFLLAEGVQAFATQCLALNFCAIHSDQPIQARLRVYLNAWLYPQKASECT